MIYIKFSEIDAFLAIIETKSFTKAAEKLYMSQSTVSHQLRNLEEELGITLILRKKGQREIELTREGEAFVPLAYRWMSVWQDMQAMQNSQARTTISIGCPRNLLIHALPSLINELQEVKNLNLKICGLRSADIYSAVCRKEIDIGLAFEQPQRQSNVISEPLFREKMCLIRMKKTNITTYEINPHVLDPQNEIFFPWFPEYVAWHNACWDTRNGHTLEINTSSLIPVMITNPHHWMVVPISIATYFKKELPIEIVDLINPPPDRTCYRLTHRSPGFSDVPILEKINAIIDEFCLNLPWESYKP